MYLPLYPSPSKQEKNNNINFLVISTQKTDCLSFQIYRKPTTTDHIIPNDSNHPPEQKLSAVNYLTDSLPIPLMMSTGTKNMKQFDISSTLINTTHNY